LLFSDFYRGWDVWPIFRETWYRSFEGAHLLQELMHFYSFRNIFKGLNQIKLVFYIFEMQPWEKSLCFNVKKYTNANLLALQHAILPYYFLGYFNSRVEIEENDLCSLPKPDVIACSGGIPANFLRECGWGDKTIQVWCTFRHQYLYKVLLNNYSWQRKKNQIVIATNLNLDESRKLIQLFNNVNIKNHDFNVIIKTHPALSLNNIISKDEIIFSFTQSDHLLEKLLEESKILVACGSTANLEALAYQCKVIIPLIVNTIDLSPFSATGAKGLFKYVSSSAELENELTDIINKNDQINDSDMIKAKENVNEFFKFVDKPCEYMRDKLSALGVQ
jgi:surface carbohydrate biosynthesis protein (TIGR04326 family)